MDNSNVLKNCSQIKEFFKESVTEDIFNAYSDTFDFEESGKEIQVIFHGSDFKAFKKECKSALMTSVVSVMGDGYKIKFIQRKGYNALSPKTKKNIRAAKFFVIGMAFVFVAMAVVLVLLSYIGNRSFRETFYSTSSIKVDSPVRVIQISDLHGVSYGKNNEKLISRVKALDPDLIICTGDIVDSVEEDIDYALVLAENLSKIAPSYYIYGNNEVEGVFDFPLNEKELDQKFGFDKDTRREGALLEIPDEFETKLEQAGIKVLKNEVDTIEIGTMKVDVYGALTSNPSSFWSYSEKAFLSYIDENPANIKITAVHEPFIFEEFQPEFWGDLSLCSHTHGGVVRLPVLGPLYTREGGLFPERSGKLVWGRYNVQGNPVIVSAGLENKNVLRINNEPELVIVDINKF